MVTTYKLENDLNKNLKDILLKMDKEEFQEYFKQLIKNYYAVLFTYQNNYSKYYEESIKQYETTIKTVKDLLRVEFNNLDNFENQERLIQAEEIAFNQMNTIHFLEDNYSDIIYYNTVQEIIYINATLSSLIDLYNDNPSEALLTVIENNFTATLDFIKQAKKLPVNEGSLKDYVEEVVFKKEHFKHKYKPEKDVDSISVTIPVFSLYLSEYLEKFDNILEDLKTILPEDVIEEYVYKLNLPKNVEQINFFMDSGLEREEAIKTVAYMEYISEKNKEGFLYESINSWS